MGFDRAPLADLTERQLLNRILEQQALNQEQLMSDVDDIKKDLDDIKATDAAIKDALTVKLTALQATVDSQAATIASMTAADDAQAAQIASLKTNADEASAATKELLGLVSPQTPA